MPQGDDGEVLGQAALHRMVGRGAGRRVQGAAPLLEPRVPVRSDPEQFSDLFPAQPGRAAPAPAGDGAKAAAFDPRDFSGIYIRRGGNRGFSPPPAIPPRAKEKKAADEF